MISLTTIFVAVLGVVSCAKLSRIINGEEAVPGEFAHQVTLLRNGYHMCGGSVIAQNWILTAAHCVEGQNMIDLAVVLDLHDFSNPGNEYMYLDIDTIIMHPQYGQGNGGFPNDVALLRVIVPETFDISKNIIELASGSDLFANKNCVISGWGTTEDGSGASRLMKTDVRVLTQNECESAWGSRSILSQHICVKGESTPMGSGSCNGDSGGPLVCDGLLAGVTSWGLNGCHTDGFVSYPSVYARVSHFYSWVSSNCDNCLA